MTSFCKLSWIFALLCLFMPTAANAESAPAPLIVTSNTTQLNLHGHMQWLVADKNSQLSDIQHHPEWQQHYSFNAISSKQSLWGKVTVIFDTPIEAHYFLTIGNPQLDYVSVFALDDKERILGAYLMGSKRDFNKRPVRNRLFVAPLNTNQPSITLYLRINDNGPLVFPISLEPESLFVEQQQFLLASIGFICGGLSLLAGYFLVTYIFLRSPIRFWFALSNAAFLLLFINATGLLGQMTGITTFISNLNCALFGLLLLTSAKVTFAILEKVPTLGRYALYSLGFLTLGMALINDSGQQLIFSLLVALLSSLVIVLFAYFYHNQDKKVANWVCLIGLAFIAISGMTQATLFLLAVPMDQTVGMLFIMIITLGILLVALAIEAHERVLTSRHQLQQQLTINNLQHFYELFRNATEGLYTSDVEGNLISVNPAMCTLFGYANETEMLDKVVNTQHFYAEKQDRDILLGEIRKNGKVLGKEIKGKRKDGSELWFSISAQIHQQQQNQYLFGSISDVTARKQSNISLEYLATHDSLTGIYNRRELERRLQTALVNAQQNNTDLALLYMDLQQFKSINDTCGHKAGDLLLKQLASQLEKVVDNRGILARLGGDEFALLLEDQNAQAAYLLANQLLTTVQEFRFTWENRIFTLGLSIGHVPWQQHISSPEQLLSLADSACYMAKQRGSNQIHTYSIDDQPMQRYESEMAWVTQIQAALKNDRLELYYQHFQSLSKNPQGHHYELLIRMRDQANNIVLPEVFLPAAEQFNLTAQIDRWVIDHYFQWLATHPEHHAELATVNINLSGHSLADRELKHFVLNAFEKYQIDHHKICFEIAESLAIIKMDDTLEFMHTFKSLGCRFALDDFGSGFSTFSYLKRLPVDQVKIEGAFVKDILIDPINLAMVNSMKDLARAMGIESVAKFVETPEIMIELGKMGVDYAQGFSIAKPQPLVTFSQHR